MESLMIIYGSIFAIGALELGGVRGEINGKANLNGFRIESNSIVSLSVDGRFAIPAGCQATLRLFFMREFSLASDVQISFTSTEALRGANCDDLRSTDIFNLTSVQDESALVNVLLHTLYPQPTSNMSYLMFCVRQKADNNVTWSPWIHQGNSSWLMIGAAQAERVSFFPLWGKCILIVVFIFFSGLFTGLGMSLLSLTRLELKTLRSLGSTREKHYAKIVYPLRKKGNQLLCTITLVNALANIAVTIVLYELIGLWSVLVATLGIVFMGEMLPQTVCSFFGLAIGAKTIWFTNFFIAVTFPVTYPIGQLLDWLHCEEIPSVYNRDRLQELVQSAENRAGINQQLGEPTYQKFVDLSNKSVKDIMKKLDEMYMVEYNAVLDQEQFGKIKRAGYTRLPVYESERSNIVAILHIKDLALIDTVDKVSVRTVCKFYNRPVNFVFEDTKLDTMLEEFKKGQSHMAFLQCVNNEGQGDPFYETVGMVTLEDVIEEIFHLDYKECTPMTKAVAVFHEQLISPQVLDRLIHQNVLVQICPRPVSTGYDDCLLYENGRACDYFVLLLQGRVQVDIGKERLIFDAGPFAFFGVQALKTLMSTNEGTEMITGTAEYHNENVDYIPDFTVKAVSDVLFLRINRELYMAALHATALQRQQDINKVSMDGFGCSTLLTSGDSPGRNLLSEAVFQTGNQQSSSRSWLLERGEGLEEAARQNIESAAYQLATKTIDPNHTALVPNDVLEKTTYS